MKEVNEQAHVVRITKQGSPSVLEYTTQSITTLGDDEVLMKQKAMGFNFLDIFYRNGTFPLTDFPAPIGVEAAGIITTKGEAVTRFEVGDRVVYWWSMGAYADRKVVNMKDIFRLPEDVPFDQGASLLVKGLTAHMLVKHSHSIQKGNTVLIHAVSGGVGSLLSRWAKALGATVIGTVGSTAKKKVAINNGVDHVIALDAEDFVQEVMFVTDGKGIDALYDSVGQDTFDKSLKLFSNGGTAVLFGWSSGMPVIEEEAMEKRGIKYVRATFNAYWPTVADQSGMVGEVFEAYRAGIFGEINPTIYALADAAQAHTDVEARKTTGAIIFHP